MPGNNTRAINTGLMLFVGGALIGVGVGLLFAPQSGKETRQMLKEKAIDLRDRAADMAGRIRHQVEERSA